MTPSVNVQTAAQLAFFLRGEPPSEVARLLKQVLPQVYSQIRRDHSHDEAADFTARFADAVVANLNTTAGHG